MTLYIIGYIFISLCTAVALVDENHINDWIASFVAGFLWPVIFTVRIAYKIMY